MWKNKCEVIYEFQDGRMLVVTKGDCRFDGQQAVILDSKTAQLALSNKANWKTINGSHVLVGKGGKIVTGMGGKFTRITQKGLQENTSLNGFSGVVESKDISETIEYERVPGVSGAQTVAEQLGISGKPKLVNEDEFQQAVTASGLVAYRTWADFEGRKANEFKDEFANNDKIQYNSVGNQAVGSGIYVAATPRAKAGQMPDGNIIKEVMKDSLGYGPSKRRATAVITFDKSMKIADGEKMYDELLNMDRKTAMRKYKMDLGVYLASKGYDAARFSESKNVDYIAVYNRTKMIVLNDPDHKAFGLSDEYNN